VDVDVILAAQITEIHFPIITRSLEDVVEVYSLTLSKSLIAQVYLFSSTFDWRSFLSGERWRGNSRRTLLVLETVVSLLEAQEKV